MPPPLRFIPEEAKLWTDHNGRPIALAEGTDASAPALLFGDAPIPFEGRR